MQDRLTLIEARYNEQGRGDGDKDYLIAEVKRLRGVLGEIAKMKGMTLLGDPPDTDLDRAHQIGANKAFDEAAAIAEAAL